MRSKFFYFMLLALVAVSLESLTSCKDDDDDKEEKQNEESQVSDEQADKATRFWDVVSQLTSLDNYTADYEDKTFVPTIGVASETNALVRIVATNDLQTAAQRFADLVGIESAIDANEYEWKDDAVGTLTYRQGDGITAWATVDVDIRQLPGLQQIVYRSPEQSGENGSFRGSAYYRFGDVVEKTYTDAEDGNKQKTEYWVCVRPAFGPEGKQTSHWISVSPLPMKNVWKKEKNGHSYSVPTGIGTNTEQMQNLAGMLYAIVHPELRQSAIDHQPAPGIFSSGLPMFHDFKRKNKKYHNQFFWERVKKAWQEKDICDTVFGVDMGVMENLMNHHEGTGLHFLVKGYSWWATTSNNLTLYEYTYITDNQSFTNHKVSHRDVKHDVSDAAKVINIVADYTAEHPFLSNAAFFGNEEPRYIIRHATGADLVAAGSRWDVKQPITGVEPVYVYNYEYYPEGTPGGNNHFRDLTIDEPEVTVDPSTGAMPEATVGCLIGENGLFYANKAACDAVQVKPVAMVVYYSADGKRVEKGQKWNGLAVAIDNLNNGQTCAWAEEKDIDTNCSTVAGNDSLFSHVYDGLAATTKLATDGHNHPAAKMAYDYDELRIDGFSRWFLPSTGQWILANVGMGYEWGYSDRFFFGTRYGFINDGKWLWEQAGVKNAAMDNDTYWLSTEYGPTHENRALVMKQDISTITSSSKKEPNYVRPFIAFGTGGTVDFE